MDSPVYNSHAGVQYGVYPGAGAMLAGCGCTKRIRAQLLVGYRSEEFVVLSTSALALKSKEKIDKV